ncbi:P-loop containing nucleoside triphosphate hydrolase protein [Trichoderma velutinum]
MAEITLHQPENQSALKPSTMPMELTANQQVRNNLRFSEDSVVIIVMGATGVGKSTFVSLLTDQEVEIGHDLKSCTTEVGAYSFRYNEQQTIHVIDTPGFDDTNRPDSEILQEIALFLAALYASKVRLAGLIYLHRITDTRVSGSSLKNMNMFQKLCGEKALPYVILVTTMWGALDAVENGKEIGRQRCDQLQRPEFWGDMIQKGSSMTNHDGTKSSADAIISELVKKEAHVVLDIQTEMTEKGLPLDETAAGLYLQKDFHEARERYEKDLADFKESIEQALAEKDAEAADFIKKEREAVECRMAKLQTDNAQLHLSLDQLATHVTARFRSKFPNIEPSPTTFSDSAFEPGKKALEEGVCHVQHRESTGCDSQSPRSAQEILQVTLGKNSSEIQESAREEQSSHASEVTLSMWWNILTLLGCLWKGVLGFVVDRDSKRR